MRALFVTILLLINTAAWPQVMEGLFTGMDVTDSLPALIRSGKTLVLMEVPGNDPVVFSSASKVLHSEIIKGGVDAVVYQRADLVFSGWEITQSYIGDFSNRVLQNIVLVKFDGDQSRIAAADFTTQIFQGGRYSAWTRTGPLKNIANQLYVAVANSGKPLENLLISETPEPGDLTNPIKGKRAEYFSLSMRGLKVAVPKFGDALKDQELHAIMQGLYGDNFEMVESDLSDQDLGDMGYQFILRFVHGPSREIRIMMEYEDEEGVTGHAAIRYRNGQSEAFTHGQRDHVYKFYFNHVRSNTCYLGAEWDVDLAWDQALRNHLQSLKKYTSG